jgi:hypothetical protein
MPPNLLPLLPERSPVTPDNATRPTSPSTGGPGTKKVLPWKSRFTLNLDSEESSAKSAKRI